MVFGLAFSSHLRKIKSLFYLVSKHLPEKHLKLVSIFRWIKGQDNLINSNNSEFQHQNYPWIQKPSYFHSAVYWVRMKTYTFSQWMKTKMGYSLPQVYLIWQARIGYRVLRYENEIFNFIYYLIFSSVLYFIWVDIIWQR